MTARTEFSALILTLLRPMPGIGRGVGSAAALDLCADSVLEAASTAATRTGRSREPGEFDGVELVALLIATLLNAWFTSWSRLTYSTRNGLSKRVAELAAEPRRLRKLLAQRSIAMCGRQREELFLLVELPVT